MPDLTDERAANQAQQLAAVILAGGLARRMGGHDKGLIQLAAKPMVQWSLERVGPQVGQIIINANRNEPVYADIGRPFGASVVADSRSGHLGPLAGLLTAMEHFSGSASHVFMCPCDSPFVPRDMVSTLYKALVDADADVAVAFDGKRQQPVFLLVNQRCRQRLMAFLDSGERKIDRWFAEEKLVEVDFSDQPQAFRNVNTDDELKLLERELGATADVATTVTPDAQARTD